MPMTFAARKIFARLRDGLQQHGMAANSILIFVTDRGSSQRKEGGCCPEGQRYMESAAAFRGSLRDSLRDSGQAGQAQGPSEAPFVPQGKEVLMLLVGAEVGHAEGLAIGEHDFEDASGRIAVLDGLDGDGDLVAGLEAAHAPATFDHVGEIIGFGHPVHHVAAIVFDVKLQPAVRIGPHPFGDGALENDFFADVECGVAMMGGERNGKNRANREN